VSNIQLGPTQTSGTPADVRWWLETGNKAADSITAAIQAIVKNSHARLAQLSDSAMLYDGNLFGGLFVYGSQRSYSAKPNSQSLQGLNLCSSMVETLTSRMLSNKPRAMFITDQGSYKLQRKAQKLSEFVDGVGYENKVYFLGATILRDSCMWGPGIVKVFALNGRVKYERVLPTELYVDPLESMYGTPRQMHQIRNVDRQMLCEMFPDSAPQIKSAAKASFQSLSGMALVADVITLRESWHTKSGPGADDGKHIISIEGCSLFEEDYDSDRFPFAILNYQAPVVGIFGKGLIERVQHFQKKLNFLEWVVYRSQRLAGTFKIWIKTGSRVVDSKLSNEIAQTIQSDDKPEYILPPIVQPEIYNQIAQIKSDAYHQEGISELAAQGKKPADLSSSIALRTYDDISTDRTQSFGQAYENWFLDLNALTIEVAKQIAEESDFEVKSASGKYLKTLKWSEVSLQDDEFSMKAFPVSSLPKDPEGRLATIQQFIQAGMLSVRSGRRLLDYPDLDAAESLANAPEDYLHMILEKIIDDGDYTPPEPINDLSLAASLAVLYLHQGLCNGLEEEKIEMLRRFIDQVNSLLEDPTSPDAPAAPPTDGATPQANPEPTPQSALIPNVPPQGPQ
jgi:hypothetical protein